MERLRINELKKLELRNLSQVVKKKTWNDVAQKNNNPCNIV